MTETNIDIGVNSINPHGDGEPQVALDLDTADLGEEFDERAAELLAVYEAVGKLLVIHEYDEADDLPYSADTLDQFRDAVRVGHRIQQSPQYEAFLRDIQALDDELYRAACKTLGVVGDGLTGGDLALDWREATEEDADPADYLPRGNSWGWH